MSHASNLIFKKNLELSINIKIDFKKKHGNHSKAVLKNTFNVISTIHRVSNNLRFTIINLGIFQ